MNSERDFAQRALRDYRVYVALAEGESNPEFKDILSSLAEAAKEQFAFWSIKSGLREDEIQPSRIRISFYTLLRRLLGLTLTVRYIQGIKSERTAMYKTYCATCSTTEDYRVIEAMAERMESIADDIEEERIAFFSNIILGFNDALIELTGALVGFAFALKDPKLITIGGFITGVSASMSMAASAFLQARHETGKNPVKAALFTGGAYFVIAIILITPFLILTTIPAALGLMFVFILCMISIVSFYSAILLQKRYVRQFGEMLILSLGVAGIAFIIGQSIAVFIGN